MSDWRVVERRKEERQGKKEIGLEQQKKVDDVEFLAASPSSPAFFVTLSKKEKQRERECALGIERDSSIQTPSLDLSIHLGRGALPFETLRAGQSGGKTR